MKKVRLNSKVREALQGSSRGIGLIEVLIALALLGIIAITFLSGLSTASMALIIADERATAESLARSQMEFVKNQPYFDYSESGHEDYDGICDVIECEGYTVKVEAEALDDPDNGTLEDIQQITVIVSRDDKIIITMEGYKRAP